MGVKKSVVITQKLLLKRIYLEINNWKKLFVFPDFFIFQGLRKSEDSSISDSLEESLLTSMLSLSRSQIFTEPFSSFDLIFCPLNTIAVASSARRALASAHVDILPIVLHCFRFFDLVRAFPRFMITQLIRITYECCAA